MAFLTILGSRQLVATHGNGFRLFLPFRGVAVCYRLPLVATARLHKRSMPVVRIPGLEPDSMAVVGLDSSADAVL